MKVLILNPGSSSLRYALISADPPTGDQVRGKELLSGVIEPITDHAEAASQLFARMHWTAADFDLMALRVVQGGDLYHEPVRIDQRAQGLQVPFSPVQRWQFPREIAQGRQRRTG